MKKQRHYSYRLLGIFLFAVLFCFSVNRTSAKAEGTTMVSVTGVYDQTGARRMLELINHFRTNEGTAEGDQAWWLDPNGSGERIAVNGLSELTYDYNLESIAMLRAAELAVQYGHARPFDRKTQAIALPEVNGENILYGQISVEEAFNSWLEADEETFEGQGHRVNMLGGYYVFSDGEIYQNFLTTIGISHFIYEGVHFWVQIFGMREPAAGMTEPVDGERTVEVEAADSLIQGYVIDTGGPILVEYHSTLDLSDLNVTTMAAIKNVRYLGTHYYPVSSSYTWNLPGTFSSIASLSGSSLYGKDVGTGQLSVTNLQGKTQNVPFSVTAKDIAGAQVSAAKTQFETGSPFRLYSGAGPQVTLDGEQLVYGTDYTLNIYRDGSLLYGDLTEDKEEIPGSACEYSYEFCGIGKYTGTASQQIVISVQPPVNLQITADSGTDIALAFGETSVQATVSCPYLLDNNTLTVTVTDESVVTAQAAAGNWDNTRSVYVCPVEFTPKKAGSTQVEVYFPQKENVNAESNHIVFSVTVAPADLENAEVTGIEESYKYTGSPVTPKPEVYLNGTKLTEGSDYSVHYEINGEEISSPTGSSDSETQVRIVITALEGGNVTGETETTFLIVPLRLEVTLDASYPYRASGVHPVPAVTCQGETLTVDEDYTLSYGDNNEVGTGKGSVSVTGTGSYAAAGSRTVYFDIVPADITAAQVSAGKTQFKVGEHIRLYSDVLPKAVLEGDQLVFGRDFSLDIYRDGAAYLMNLTEDSAETAIPAAACEYTYQVMGMGNYTGTASAQIKVKADPAEDLQITTQSQQDIWFEFGDNPVTAQVYCQYDIGSEDLTVVVNDESIVDVQAAAGTWDNSLSKMVCPVTFTPKEVGSTQVDVYFPLADNAHNESNHISFSITVGRIPFNEHVTASFAETLDCKFTPPDYEWEPAVNVYYDGTTLLEKGTDYTVSYQDNIYPGEGTAVILPVDTAHYAGSVTLTFTIGMCQTQMVLDKDTLQLGYGEEKTVSLSGCFSSGTPVLAVEGNCITAQLTSFNYKQGTGVITVKGTKTGTAVISISQEADDNCSGTSGTVSVTVIEADVPEEKIEVTLLPAEYVYDGSAKEPYVTVSIDGGTLEEDLYDIAYSSNTDPGTASVMVTGKNGPVFTKTASFKISLCNTQDLEALIESASEEARFVAVSADGSDVDVTAYWVTQEVMDGINGSISQAQTFLSREKYTSAEVEEMCDTLQTALTSFLSAKKSGLTVKATGISVDPEQITLLEGASAQLTAKVMPENALDRTFGWTSSDSSIASVDETGLVSAHSIGSAVISAVATDGGWIAACQVSVVRDLSGYTAALSYETAEYTGSALTPAVTVTDGTRVLAEGKDYTVSYSDNNRAGTAHVTVTGKGSYIGTIRLSFVITQKETPSSGSGTSGTGSAGSGTSGTGTAGAGAGQAPGSTQTAGGLAQDGTAVGKGASYETADRAITTMTSDEAPAGSEFYQLTLKSTKQTKNSIRITWSGVPGASRYVVYGNACGKQNKMMNLAAVPGTSYNLKMVNGQKLKKGTYYKLLVVALDSSSRVVSTSKTIHVATKGGKVGNQKKITTSAKSTRVTIKAGKTFRLKTKAAAASKKLKVKKHRAIQYESSNPQIAEVSSKGVIKAKNAGNCLVYAYGQNGVFLKIRVTVK